jgi:uncharacterized protein YcbK (DUF882 family)
MLRRFGRRAVFTLVAILGIVAVTRSVLAFRRFVGTGGDGPLSSPTAPPGAAGGVETSVRSVMLSDTLFGQSGALRFATLSRAEALAVPGFLRVFGEAALHRPGTLTVSSPSGPFTLFVLVPFAAKRGGFVNGYRLGQWPAERWIMARNYFNPEGFVEVTRQNAGLALSQHFTLGEFVTHDQDSVWPKYVVLEPPLIDKLELVLRDLSSHGYRADHAVVLSGFRAPYYNELGAAEGMARASRHQYGDAADIIIDDDRDGRMDDLDGDGRLTLRDMLPLTDAIARVERAYPALVGGLGTYAAMGPHGPFAHVDVRGTSARWEDDPRRGRRP